jgi:hypothetical protein
MSFQTRAPTGQCDPEREEQEFRIQTIAGEFWQLNNGFRRRFGAPAPFLREGIVPPDKKARTKQCAMVH